MDDRDREELAAFCAREHRRLVGTLTLHCGDAGVAAELAQEALAKACQSWKQVQAMDAPGAWVHRVAINLSSSYYRRRKAERAATERFRSRRQVDEDLADSAETADVLAVRKAVSGLPTRQRTALVYRYYSDLSVEQTAEAMGCRPGTVKSLTSQALSALRASGLTDLEENAHA
jgi:RNA polymerase sigma-70 factor (sigma-E family)